LIAPGGLSSPSSASATAGRLAGETPGRYPFAESKIMELLDQLGQAQQRLVQQETVIRALCPLCWTTDSSLRVTGFWGSLAEELESRAGDLTGRPVRDLLDAAMGAAGPSSPLLAIHRKAVNGLPVSVGWEQDGRRLIVFADPIRGPEGDITGTVGLAVDVTSRQAEPGLR
jgi:hypothetical protein